ELEPGESGRAHGLGDAPEPLRPEMEIGVEHDADVRPAALAESLDRLRRAARDIVVPVTLGEAAPHHEARAIGGDRAVRQLDRDVGLEAAVALGLDLGADLG